MQFATTEIFLEFPVPFQWSIEDISNCVLNWLLSTNETDQFSMVGVMSSNQFTSLIAGCLAPRLATPFKALVFAASSLRNASHFQNAGNLADLLPFAECAGFQVPKQLEQHISPRKFGSLPVIARLSLFLVLTGSIISVKYYQQFMEVWFSSN
jgi:hypothetical protein